eukprot:6206719-Prymnesium_polylepis.1
MYSCGTAVLSYLGGAAAPRFCRWRHLRARDRACMSGRTLCSAAAKPLSRTLAAQPHLPGTCMYSSVPHMSWFLRIRNES